MSALDWASLGAAVTAILSGFGLFTRWIVKSFLMELKPNGGSSLSDKVKLEILPILTEIKSDLAELKGRLDEHMREHNK
jgi:hypothetical protein